MPVVNVKIIKAWRFSTERTRIHFTVERLNGDIRHCKVDEGDALYDVLDDHLRGTGYERPASAGDGS